MIKTLILFLVLTSNCYADFEWYETPPQLRTQPQSPPQLLNPLDIERLYGTDVQREPATRSPRLPRKPRVDKPAK